MDELHTTVANDTPLETAESSFGTEGPNDGDDAPKGGLERVEREGPEAAETEPEFDLDNAKDAILGSLVGDETLPEVIIGVDERVRIEGTTRFPWRAIAHLEIHARDGTQFIGTGWFVSPRTLITAGHCIYMEDHGGWARAVRVIPGRNGSVEPFGSATATRFRSVRGWVDNHDRDYDYGAIILDEDDTLGSRVGWFGFANLTTSQLRELRVNLSGYPGDQPRGTQWWDAETLKSVSSKVLTYDIDTAGGQSGSPVWRYAGGQRRAVGIHTNGSLKGNSATRIESSVFANIVGWRDEGR